MEFTVNQSFFDFINSIKNKSSHEQFMYLSIFIDDSNDGELKKLYVESAEKHNAKILEDPHFYDAGFDMFLPKTSDEADICGEGTRFYSTGCTDIHFHVNKIDFKIKCCAKMYNQTKSYFTPFYTYARSSMSKTPLRLANNQGIIDAGYRGNLIGMFDCIYNTGWYMEKYSRMLQICAPGLVPIYVNIVNSIEELGPSTSRGVGGFGSTGK